MLLRGIPYSNVRLTWLYMLSRELTLCKVTTASRRERLSFLKDGARVQIWLRSRLYSYSRLLVQVKALDGRIDKRKADERIGRFSCVGKNFALAELRLVKAFLVKKYNVSFADEKQSSSFLDDVHDCFITMTGPLDLQFRTRPMVAAREVWQNRDF